MLKIKPLFSIVIISYNTKQLLLNCLNSIVKQTINTSYEIVVVDNNSTDGSIEMLEQFAETQEENVLFSELKLIKNNTNTGFGTANNQAINSCNGKWLLLLNSDTVFKDNTLDKISQILKEHNYPEHIILGPQLLNQDGSIQPSAGFSPTIKTLLFQFLFIDKLPFIKNYFQPYQQSNRDFYKQEHEVDWITGACISMDKHDFRLVGGFDSKIFMYGEEVELFLRLKKLGCRVFFTPEVSLYHLKGQSSPDGFEAAILGEYKGLMYIYQKHFPQDLGKLKLILKIGTILRILLFTLINPSKAKIYREAWGLI